MLTKGDNLKRIRIKVFLYTRLGGVSVYGDFATTQLVYTVRVYFYLLSSMLHIYFYEVDFETCLKRIYRYLNLEYLHTTENTFHGKRCTYELFLTKYFSTILMNMF